jgi:hypothetical protein
MSAQALRYETKNRAEKLEAQFVRELVDITAGDVEMVRWRQGVIHGIHLMLAEQEDAYKAIGM